VGQVEGLVRQDGWGRAVQQVHLVGIQDQMVFEKDGQDWGRAVRQVQLAWIQSQVVSEKNRQDQGRAVRMIL
jgi:hypothetical protein